MGPEPEQSDARQAPAGFANSRYRNPLPLPSRSEATPHSPFLPHRRHRPGRTSHGQRPVIAERRAPRVIQYCGSPCIRVSRIRAQVVKFRIRCLCHDFSAPSRQPTSRTTRYRAPCCDSGSPPPDSSGVPNLSAASIRAAASKVEPDTACRLRPPCLRACPRRKRSLPPRTGRRYHAPR